MNGPSLRAVTIVSLIPVKIREEKPGLTPWIFEIPECKDLDSPVVVSVGEAKYDHYIPGEGKREMQFIPIRVLPQEYAESLCDDWRRAQIAGDEDASPGLYWVDGDYKNFKMVQQMHPDVVEERMRLHLNWLRNIVREADADWSGTGSQRVITDLMRKAVTMLGLERPWMSLNPNQAAPEKCPACKSILNVGASICHICRTVVNEEEAAKFTRLTT